MNKKINAFIIILLIINVFFYLKLFNAYKTVSALEKKLPIYNVERNDKKISLTFDVNWGDNNVEEILDILDKYKIKSSFFIIGKWAEINKEDVIKIYERNQEIGNHSYSHKYFSKISRESMKAEILKCDKVIKNITGDKPDLFRFPSGDYNNLSVNIVYETEHLPIQWSVDSIDWMEEGADIEFNRVINKTKSGDIILLHTNAKYTKVNLPRIIETLQNKGFEFVPVTELIYKNSEKTDKFGKQLK